MSSLCPATEWEHSDIYLRGCSAESLSHFVSFLLDFELLSVVILGPVNFLDLIFYLETVEFEVPGWDQKYCEAVSLCVLL